MESMVEDIIKVIAPAAAAFFIGVAATPLLTHYLYRYRAWKKKAGKVALGGGETPVFTKLHEGKEVGTPRMGGIVIWFSASVTILGVFALARLFPVDPFLKFDFLSRDQTWMPFFMLLVGAVVGLLDDLFEVSGRGSPAGGLSLRHRLFLVGSAAAFLGWWFYAKLGVHAVGIPFAGDLEIGSLIVPFFIIVTLALYAGGIIDGIDGLSGGVFAIIFSAYAALAFFQEQLNLAAFAATLVGGTLAFLWFNIPPARFYMSETGSMALTLALAAIAFMTDSLGGGVGVAVLPVVAFPLVVTVLSVILQVASKRIRGKKIFLVAPLHHHFEALGWPGYKVTMRYWVLSAVFALLGVILGLVG